MFPCAADDLHLENERLGRGGLAAPRPEGPFCRGSESAPRIPPDGWGTG